MGEPSPEANLDGVRPSIEQLETLFNQITAVALRLRQRASDLQAPDGLPQGAKLVLEVLLRHGPRTVPQIARLRSTSRQNIQILVNRLERDGHAALLQNPAHKRSPFVQLTETGRVVLLQVLRSEGVSAEPLQSHLSHAEVQVATELLGRLAHLLTPGEESVITIGKEKTFSSEIATSAATEVTNKRQLTVTGDSKRGRPEVEETTTDLPVNLL